MNSLSIKNRIRTFLFALIGINLLRLIYLSISWKRLKHAEDRAFWDNSQPKILAFWHNQQLMGAWIYSARFYTKPQLPMNVMISQHGDGRIIARAMRFIGISSVAGSSTKGGRSALRELTQLIREGSNASITPDGPTGPIYKAKPGIVKLAQETGAPIYPLAIATSKYWTFGSWDRMTLPKPFCKGVFMLDDPINIPSKLSELEFLGYLNLVESKLNSVTEEANSFFTKANRI